MSRENPCETSGLVENADECKTATVAVILLGYLGVTVAVGFFWNSIVAVTLPQSGLQMRITFAAAAIGLLPFGIALQPRFRRTRLRAYVSSMCAGGITILTLVLTNPAWPGLNSVRVIAGVYLSAITVGGAAGFVGCRLAATAVAHRDQ